MWVHISREIVAAAGERHAWHIDREVKGRWPLPVAYNVPKRVVEPSHEVKGCAVDAVHEARSRGDDDRVRIGRRLAIKAAEGVVGPEEDGVFVVGRGAEIVRACYRGAVEALVDDSEVVGIDGHTTVSAALPADEVGRVGQGRVRVNAWQIRWIDVLWKVGLVRERGFQGN